MTRCIDVAVAVMQNAHGQVLVQQRAADSHQGGLWEFPGGKFENDETPLQALQREIHEELGVLIDAASPLISIRHDYGDRQVCLHVYRVTSWVGGITAREQQPLSWVAASQLDQLAMPAADRPIIAAIRLPEHCVITPPVISDVDAFLARFEGLLTQGIGLFIYRVFSLQKLAQHELQQHMLERCEASMSKLIIHEHSATDVSAHGIHLTEKTLMAGLPARQHANLHAGQLLSVSCHSDDALQRAADMQADFALLSPVQETASHPAAIPMGWERFAQLVDAARLPVFALGGVTAADCNDARSRGAQGVAGISCWWSHTVDSAQA